MKKYYIWTILAILLIVGVYCGYKSYCLVRYDVSHLDEDVKKKINALRVTSTIQIHKTKPKEEVFEFQNIKIENPFSKEDKIDRQQQHGFIRYIVWDEEKNEGNAYLTMGKTDMYVELLKSDVTLYANENTGTNPKPIKRYLEKHHIENDMELFQYLREQQNKKMNLFTNADDIKGWYSLNYLMYVLLPNIQSMTLLEGDYQGYILNLSDSLREVAILKDGKKYSFVFGNMENLDDEVMKKMLDKVEIQ